MAQELPFSLAEELHLRGDRPLLCEEAPVHRAEVGEGRPRSLAMYARNAAFPWSAFAGRDVH